MITQPSQGERSTLSYYLLWTFGGLAQVWLLLFYWGYSTGPANPVPYLTLAGSLVVALVAAPLCSFVARPAAALAIVGSSLALTWAGSGAHERPLSIAFMVMVGIIPLTVGTLSLRYLLRTRDQPWFASTRRMPLWLTLGLALAPGIVFFGLLKGGDVLMLLARSR